LEEIGKIYGTLGRSDLAIESLKKALQVAKRSENREWQMSTLQLLSVHGSDTDSKKTNQEMMELSKSLKNPRLEAQARLNLAQMEIESNKLESADEEVKKALNLIGEVRILLVLF
jgi:tetratricopeptide (TPR) repeat protein